MKNLYDSSSTTTTITAAVAATEDDEDHDDHYDADAVVEKDAGDDGFQLAGLTVREVGNLFAAHDLGMYLQVLEANGVDGSILADPALCEQDLEVKTVATGDIRNYPLPTGTGALLLCLLCLLCVLRICQLTLCLIYCQLTGCVPCGSFVYLPSQDMGMKPFHYRKVFRLIERWLESGCEFSNS